MDLAVREDRAADAPAAGVDAAAGGLVGGGKVAARRDRAVFDEARRHVDPRAGQPGLRERGVRDAKTPQRPGSVQQREHAVAAGAVEDRGGRAGALHRDRAREDVARSGVGPRRDVDRCAIDDGHVRRIFQRVGEAAVGVRERRGRRGRRVVGERGGRVGRIYIEVRRRDDDRARRLRRRPPGRAAVVRDGDGRAVEAGPVDVRHSAGRRGLRGRAVAEVPAIDVASASAARRGREGRGGAEKGRVSAGLDRALDRVLAPPEPRDADLGGIGCRVGNPGVRHGRAPAARCGVPRLDRVADRFVEEAVRLVEVCGRSGELVRPANDVSADPVVRDVAVKGDVRTEDGVHVVEAWCRRLAKALVVDRLVPGEFRFGKNSVVEPDVLDFSEEHALSHVVVAVLGRSDGIGRVGGVDAVARLAVLPRVGRILRDGLPRVRAVVNGVQRESVPGRGVLFGRAQDLETQPRQLSLVMPDGKVVRIGGGPAEDGGIVGARRIRVGGRTVFRRRLQGDGVAEVQGAAEREVFEPLEGVGVAVRPASRRRAARSRRERDPRRVVRAARRTEVRPCRRVRIVRRRRAGVADAVEVCDEAVLHVIVRVIDANGAGRRPKRRDCRRHEDRRNSRGCLDVHVVPFLWGFMAESPLRCKVHNAPVGGYHPITQETIQVDALESCKISRARNMQTRKRCFPRQDDGSRPRPATVTKAARAVRAGAIRSWRRRERP